MGYGIKFVERIVSTLVHGIWLIVQMGGPRGSSDWVEWQYAMSDE